MNIVYQVDMPIPLLVVIIIAGVLLSIWLLAVITSAIFSSVFGHKIKTGSKGINVLIKQRFEIVSGLVKLLEKHNLEVSKNHKEVLAKLDKIDDFQKLKKRDRDGRILNFVHTSHDLFIIAEAHQEKFDQNEYKLIKENFNQIEDLYRQKSAIYNSDVIGYNYWIHIPFVKFLFVMFKKTPKDLIV